MGKQCIKPYVEVLFNVYATPRERERQRQQKHRKTVRQRQRDILTKSACTFSFLYENTSSELCRICRYD